MKKIIFGVLSLLLAFCLVACGSEGDSSSSTDQGTRDNPYEVGDTVTLQGIKTLAVEEPYAETPLDLKITVEETYSLKESAELAELVSENVCRVIAPTAKITFKLEGDYDDEIWFDDYFSISVISDDMETYSYDCVNCNNWNVIDTVFTGQEYNCYISTDYDSSTGEVTPAKYIMLKYYTDESNYQQTIYFSLDDTNSETEVNEEKISSEAEETTDETTAATSSAKIAEELGYLKVAENLYEKEGNTEKYEEMKNRLAVYDGTYYGESTEFDGVKIYIYIQDGYVKTQFDDGDNELAYGTSELYEYESRYDGSTFPAFSNEITDLFEWDNGTRYGDGYGISKPNEDGRYIVAATEGSTFYTWNGFYDKISDTVKEGVFE